MPPPPPTTAPLRVLVLAGGPDREREVSLVSGAAVADALRQAGHDVRTSDIGPDDLAALDDFAAWPGDVIFPVLHGRWGEGGGLQAVLDARNLPYVGSRADAAALCMDKGRTKAVLKAHGLPTPGWRTLAAGEPLPDDVTPPVVVKAVSEGSSFGLTICRDVAQLTEAVARLSRTYDHLLVEDYIAGMEVTVGVIDQPNEAGPRTLPPIQIVPAGEYYDFDAKYSRSDTQYLFDIPLPGDVLATIDRLAARAYDVLGVRHLGRVDFLVDADHRPWILEVNTIPGFTSHSLLPMAANRADLPMPTLVNHLAHLKNA